MGTIEQYIWIEKETSDCLNGSYKKILCASRGFSVHKKIWKAKKNRKQELKLKKGIFIILVQQEFSHVFLVRLPKNLWLVTFLENFQDSSNVLFRLEKFWFKKKCSWFEIPFDHLEIPIHLLICQLKFSDKTYENMKHFVQKHFFEPTIAFIIFWNFLIVFWYHKWNKASLLVIKWYLRIASRVVERLETGI